MEEIEIEGAKLELPPAARGLVILDGSPRDRLLAEVLKRSLATLLLDLPPDGRRLVQATEWAAAHLRHLRLGYLISAPLALEVAARLPQLVGAVVCMGGCSGLPGVLERVRASTLLIVGSDDVQALIASQAALTRLAGVRELAVLPGAGPRFGEPGALGLVAELARGWFELYLDVGEVRGGNL